MTVILNAKGDFIEEVKTNLQQLVAKATKEEGCLQYELHQSIGTPNVFVFHETWENEELLDLHNSQAYLKNFFTLAPSLMSEPIEVLFTNKLA